MINSNVLIASPRLVVWADMVYGMCVRILLVEGPPTVVPKTIAGSNALDRGIDPSSAESELLASSTCESADKGLILFLIRYLL